MFELTKHQQETGDGVIEALRKGHNRIILTGAAGVGKTTLVTWLVNKCLRDHGINAEYNNGCVYITAPTNKALSVLQSKIPEKPGSIFKTVHSALKLKRIIEKSGDIKFIPGFTKVNRKEDFVECKMAFVDESSMVNSEILKYLDDYSFPIVFVGDRFQINPVGEIITPVFDRNYTQFELTEIIRQGAGNPIIELSRDIDKIYFKIPKVVDGKGYIYNDNLDILTDQLAESNGTDEMKYLAWTNVQIDAINDMVRRRIYGEPRRVELGETLVFNSPLEAYFTNKEVKVETLEIVTGNIPVPRFSTRFDSTNRPITPTDSIKMRYYRVNNSFNIVHEDSDVVFKEISNGLRECCKKYAWKWPAFYFFTEQFADIKYNHAISVHKSQGSTYKTVIVNIGNINFNKNAEEKQRLLYTAVTRASDLVILNNVP